jgi:formyl-CoA transferase
VNLYPCAPSDGGTERGPNDYAFIMCVTTRMWDSLATAIGQPELATDPRFETGEARLEHADALYDIVSAWTCRHTKHEVMRILGEAGVPVSKNFDTYDLFHDEHLLERGFVHTLDHPEHGQIRLLGFAPRLSKSQVPLRHGPLMGEHSDEVLREDLGVDDARLEELRASGVVS